MDNLIEVEIENSSYIELLSLNKNSQKTLNLTTLVDNQTAVIIKIFLNKSGDRTLLKEFYIRNLKLKISGLPRFELNSSYDGKFLSLILLVDGKKTDHSEINLRPYLRNKLLLLFIILSLIAVFLIFTGGKWLFSEFISNTPSAHVAINKAEDTKSEDILTITNNKAEKISDGSSQSDTKTKTELVAEQTTTVPIKNQENSSITKKVETTLYTAYFNPNSTVIQKEASIILKNIAKELKNLPNVKVGISGYCAMTGTEDGRERLSKERAYNVLDYLKKEGWIPNTEPVVKWYGGKKPVTLNQKEIYRNRRVEITIDIP